MLADRIIVTTDGDHTSVGDTVGLIFTYRRDIQCLNNHIMDTIIICPEAVISMDGNLNFDFHLRSSIIFM